MTEQFRVTKDTWFLQPDGTRKKMRFEEVLSSDISLFREHSPTDKQHWHKSGGSGDGNSPALVMRDHCQYDNYGPVPATVDTPNTLEVTLYLRCKIDKSTNVINESILGGPGMGTEDIVRYAYAINGKPAPDAAGLAWWVNQINTGRWQNIVDFLLGINAVFADARRA